MLSDRSWGLEKLKEALRQIKQRAKTSPGNKTSRKKKITYRLTWQYTTYISHSPKCKSIVHHLAIRTDLNIPNTLPAQHKPCVPGYLCMTSKIHIKMHCKKIKYRSVFINFSNLNLKWELQLCLIHLKLTGIFN